MSKTNNKKETGEDKKLHGVKHKISGKKRKTPPKEYTEMKSNLKPGDQKNKKKQNE